MRPLKYSIIAIAFLLLSLLGVGLALPGAWRAEATIELAVSPAMVFPLLEDLHRWDEWTLWGDVESTFSGTLRGTGAIRSWENDDFGSGSIRITEVEQLRRVRYEVEVGGGSLTVNGSFEIEATSGGSLIRWEEAGDFGWNPLMGYQARFMAKAQGAQLRESLAQLAEVLQAPAR